MAKTNVPKTVSILFKIPKLGSDKSKERNQQEPMIVTERDEVIDGYFQTVNHWLVQVSKTIGSCTICFKPLYDAPKEDDDEITDIAVDIVLEPTIIRFCRFGKLWFG